MYIDKLDYILHEYNCRCHTTIKMKLIGVKLSKYSDINVDNNEKHCKFEVGDQIKISKSKSIFATFSYTAN